MTNRATEPFNPNIRYPAWVFGNCYQYHLPQFWETQLPVYTLYRSLMKDDGNDTESDDDEGTWMDPYLIFAFLNTGLSANDIRALYAMNSPESVVPDMRPCPVDFRTDPEYLARGSQWTPQHDWDVLCEDGRCDDGVAFPALLDLQALAAQRCVAGVA
jgi:hypothetical protein